MIPSSSLLVDAAAGRQVVRPPRTTDTLGTTLHEGYPIRGRLPDDMLRLLATIDARSVVSGRG